jgi:hypothetical protein
MSYLLFKHELVIVNYSSLNYDLGQLAKEPNHEKHVDEMTFDTFCCFNSELLKWVAIFLEKWVKN